MARLCVLLLTVTAVAVDASASGLASGLQALAMEASGSESQSLFKHRLDQWEAAERAAMLDRVANEAETELNEATSVLQKVKPQADMARMQVKRAKVAREEAQANYNKLQAEAESLDAVATTYEARAKAKILSNYQAATNMAKAALEQDTQARKAAELDYAEKLAVANKLEEIANAAQQRQEADVRQKLHESTVAAKEVAARAHEETQKAQAEYERLARAAMQ